MLAGAAGPAAHHETAAGWHVVITTAPSIRSVRRSKQRSYWYSLPRMQAGDFLGANVKFLEGDDLKALRWFGGWPTRSTIDRPHVV